MVHVYSRNAGRAWHFFFCPLWVQFSSILDDPIYIFFYFIYLFVYLFVCFFAEHHSVEKHSRNLYRPDHVTSELTSAENGKRKKTKKEKGDVYSCFVEVFLSILWKKKCV